VSFRAGPPPGTVAGVTNRLGRRARHTLLVLHYVSSVGWLGVGCCQLTLNLVALATGDPALRHAAHEIAHVLDISVLTLLALTSATTGILLAVRQKWGLVRYWWVAVKLVVTVVLLVYTPVWMGGWIRQAIEATAHGPGGAGYATVRDELMVSSVGIVTTLVLVTVISVVKPWGRTPRGRRTTQQRHGRDESQGTEPNGHRVPERGPWGIVHSPKAGPP
jgi:uncharacterized membrane protein